MDNIIPLNEITTQNYINNILLKAQINLISKIVKDKNPELFEDFAQKLKDSIMKTIESDPLIKKYLTDSQIEYFLNEISLEL